MKIFVAIPVYDGKLSIQTVMTLLHEQAVALRIGDDLTVNFLSSDSGIAGARNTLAKEFLDSDADKLVFLDSDITFEPGTLVKLAHMPVDFVGGCYRYKYPEEGYPINWLPDPEKKGIPMIRCGLLEVESLPTGFLALSKKVFETLKEKHPDRTYYHHGKPGHAYFQIPFKDGAFYGEDIFFCKEWREAGGKIFLDPEAKLTHWSFNPTPYKSDIAQWIKNQSLTEKVEQNVGA